METDVLIQKLKELPYYDNPEDAEVLLEAIRQLTMFTERHSINRPNPLFGNDRHTQFSNRREG